MGATAIQKTFELAVHSHKSDRFQEAEEFYKQILGVNSRYIEAIHNQR